MSMEFNTIGADASPTEATTLVDFADSFAAKVNSLDMPDCHPAGATTIWHWLCFMRAAAENERPVLVAEYARMITDKIAQERQWAAESHAAAEGMRP